MVTKNTEHKKNKDISIEMKREIALFSKENPGFSQRSLSKHFSISLGSINNIIKNQKHLINLEESEIKNVKKKSFNNFTGF